MSFVKGISYHHETNSVSQPTINNNISISQSQIGSNELRASNETKEVRVEHQERRSDPASPDSNLSVVEQSVIPSENENAFLKKVLAIYMNQRFYFSGKFIVLTPDELLDLIQTLLPGKSVVITSNDLEDVSCCSFKDAPIKKVDSIWIEDESGRYNFKYQYSNLVGLLDQYKVSIKFVRLV